MGTKEDSYNEVTQSGKAAKQREVIKDLLRHHRTGLSRREIADSTGFQLSAVCGRVNEMLEKDLTPKGKKKCTITGKKVEVIGLIGQKGIFY